MHRRLVPRTLPCCHLAVCLNMPAERMPGKGVRCEIIRQERVSGRFAPLVSAIATTNAIILSLRPSDFARAFGRAVAALRRRLDAGRPEAKASGYQPPLYLKSNSKSSSRLEILDFRRILTPTIELCLDEIGILRCKRVGHSLRNSDDGRRGEVPLIVVLLSILFWQRGLEVFGVLRLLRTDCFL
jgi:hypothetical protein